ncbi:MAG: glycosyltransferase family 4 protein [Bacteroidota bacterium]
MKKRICMVRHGYLPQDPRVRKEALALVEAGHEVVIVCSRDAGECSKESWKDIEIHRLSIQHIRKGIFRYLYEYTAFFLLAFFKVTRLHHKKKFQVIQVNTMPDFLVFVGLIPRIDGAKIIIDMHELMPEFFASKFHFSSSKIIIDIIRIVEKISMKFADEIIAPSELRKKLIVSRPVNPEKITVVYNSPDEEVFDYKRVNHPSDTEEIIDIIAHGTIIKLYGFQVLIKALPHVITRYPALKVAVIGSGEYLDELKAMAAGLHMENNVNFPGRLPLESLPAIIKKSKICVISILRDEFTDYAAPNKLFEYIAMRSPVVCTDLKGIREYVDDSQVLYFQSGNENDLAEKIVFLLTNAVKRLELTENAWISYQKYRWNKNKIVYQNLIANSLS